MYLSRLSTVCGDPLEASIAIGRFILMVSVTQPLIESSMGIRFFSHLGFGVLKFIVENGHQLQITRFPTYMRHVADESQQFREILCFSSLFKIGPVMEFQRIATRKEVESIFLMSCTGLIIVIR